MCRSCTALRTCRHLLLKQDRVRQVLPARCRRAASIVIAPSMTLKRSGSSGLVVPFSIGTDLPDGATVSYTVAALNAKGSAMARRKGQ